MISERQHEANLRNARLSTGPQTAEGKEAVRFNALKHGLRARCTVLPFENAEEFERLCTALEQEWQPRTATERLHVEQLAVDQWLLRRLAALEGTIYLQPMDVIRQCALIERFSAQRARLENSFSRTMRDLIQLQKRRPQPQPEPQPQPQPQPVPAVQPKRPALDPPDPAPLPIPDQPEPGWIMSADSR